MFVGSIMDKPRSQLTLTPVPLLVLQVHDMREVVIHTLVVVMIIADILTLLNQVAVPALMDQSL